MISSNMNLVMTVLGFAVSATFIVFVCARLMCARAVRRRRRQALAAAAPGFQAASMERSFSGLEPSVMASLPTVKYNQRIFSSRDDALCTVCLNDYAEKEMLRLLPWCGHTFHIDCIDAWLRQHSTCPICRLSLRDSPDRRPLNYSHINPQMAPAIRALHSHELQLANEIELQSQQQQQQQQPQQLQGSLVGQHQGWTSGVFEYGETADSQRNGLVSSRTIWPGKWSLRLWRRTERDDGHEGGGRGHQTMQFGAAPISQDSSVTININIGQMPTHDVSGANNSDSECDRSELPSVNDVSISLRSPRHEGRGNARNDAMEQQREVNVEPSHRSRPVNLSIELNVCDSGIFGYTAGRSQA